MTFIVDQESDFKAWCESSGNPGYFERPSIQRAIWRECSEKQLMKLAMPGLLLHFNVLTERWGTCFPFSQVKTKRVRVDAICVPKAITNWSLGPFAIEFKRPDRPPSVKLGDHIKQASDYSATLFDGFGNNGFMPVLLCPGIQGYKDVDMYSPEENRHYESARRILGGMGLGEMFVSPQGHVSIFMSASPLMLRNKITSAGQSQRKAGRGVASSPS